MKFILSFDSELACFHAESMKRIENLHSEAKFQQELTEGYDFVLIHDPFFNSFHKVVCESEISPELAGMFFCIANSCSVFFGHK